MAQVGDAAEDIRNTIQGWADANDWDETLEQLHEVPRSIQDAFARYAELLRENTHIDRKIPDVIAEAASDMAGIADKLQETITFGAQRS